MVKRHFFAIGIALSLLVGVPAHAQDLNLSAEELKTFLDANQGLV